MRHTLVGSSFCGHISTTILMCMVVCLDRMLIFWVNSIVMVYFSAFTYRPPTSHSNYFSIELCHIFFIVGVLIKCLYSIDTAFSGSIIEFIRYYDRTESTNCTRRSCFVGHLVSCDHCTHYCTPVKWLEYVALVVVLCPFNSPSLWGVPYSPPGCHPDNMLWVGHPMPIYDGATHDDAMGQIPNKASDGGSQFVSGKIDCLTSRFKAMDGQAVTYMGL